MHGYKAIPFTQASTASNLWSPASDSPFVGGWFGGWTVANLSAANSARVEFWDNASAGSGTLLGVVTLALTSSNTVVYHPPLRFFKGIYVVVTGTSPSLEGSIFFN